MFKHLLVPLDGSPFAEAALPYAVEMASRMGCDITLLRAILPPHFSDGALTIESADLVVRMRDDLYREAIAYCQHQQAALGGHSFNVHYQVVESDDIAEEISNAAQACGADTIVMSSHGRGGLSRWLYGSVAARVLQVSTIPVLIVRPAAIAAKAES